MAVLRSCNRHCSDGGRPMPLSGSATGRAWLRDGLPNCLRPQRGPLLRSNRPGVAPFSAAIAVAALAIALSPAACSVGCPGCRCCAETPRVDDCLGAAGVKLRAAHGVGDALRPRPFAATSATCAGPAVLSEYAHGRTRAKAHCRLRLPCCHQGGWRPLRGGGAGLGGDACGSEGPRPPCARRAGEPGEKDGNLEKLCLKMLAGRATSGDDASSDSEVEAEGLNLKAVLRRNALTPEEQEAFWAEWYMRARTHTHTHTTSIHTHSHPHAHTKFNATYWAGSCHTRTSHTHIHSHTHTHTHTHTHVFMYACMYVCMHVYMYVCIYVCMYT